MEIWKKVPNFVGYEVSNLGRVRSYLWNRGPMKKTPKILKPGYNGGGYLFVRLCSKGTITNMLVHRIVLLAFVGKPHKGQQCAHLNGDRKNNRLENLKWCSVSENHSHKIIHGTTQCGERNNNNRLTEKQVVSILCEMTDKTHNELAKIFNVNRSTIERVRNRTSWSHVKIPTMS